MKYRLKVRVIEPLASHPLNEMQIRTGHEGEECTVVKRGLADGQLLIRLTADGYLAIVNRDEIERIE